MQSATREDAHVIAGELKAYSKNRGVALFGSVMRDGIGHDVDLVILTEPRVVTEWWTDMGTELAVRMGTQLQPLRRIVKTYLPWLDEVSIRTRKRRRLTKASELLEVNLEEVANRCKPGLVIDCFLMPETWRNGTRLNSEVAYSLIPIMRRRKTREFLERVAATAIML